MESKEWISLVIGIALWVWDAIRAWWNTLTWRDVLLLLILLGLWASLRDLGRSCGDFGSYTKRLTRGKTSKTSAGFTSAFKT